MVNKLISFLLIFAVIIGIFTFKNTGYNFSFESYLTDVSMLEERPTFPSFNMSATTSLTDYIDKIEEEDDEKTLLKRIFNAIYQMFLRIGYIFTVVYDIGYWLVNICVYVVRLIVWFFKALTVVFVNPSLKVDTNHYNDW